MEAWKDIEGFEGLYKISNDGKVYSIKRNKILKMKVDKDGYYEVCLYNGKNNYRRVHRLVAQAFVSKPEGCDIVNHKDLNKQNNNYENLEWTTVQGNTKHAYDNSKVFHDRVQKLHNMGVEARKQKIDAYYNGEYIGTYGSKQETAKALKISEKTIYNRLHNRFSTRSGYTFVKKVVI